MYPGTPSHSSLSHSCVYLEYDLHERSVGRSTHGSELYMLESLVLRLVAMDDQMDDQMNDRVVMNQAPCDQRLIDG